MIINRLKKEKVIGLFFMFVTSELDHLNLWIDSEKIMSLKYLRPFRYVPVLPAHDVMTASREIEGTFQIL